MNKFVCFVFGILCSSMIFANELKHEFRATWFTTHYAIDWPNTKATSEIAILTSFLNSSLESNEEQERHIYKLKKKLSLYSNYDSNSGLPQKQQARANASNKRKR